VKTDRVDAFVSGQPAMISHAIAPVDAVVNCDTRETFLVAGVEVKIGNFHGTPSAEMHSCCVDPVHVATLVRDALLAVPCDELRLSANDSVARALADIERGSVAAATCAGYRLCLRLGWQSECPDCADWVVRVHVCCEDPSHAAALEAAAKTGGQPELVCPGFRCRSFRTAPRLPGPECPECLDWFVAQLIEQHVFEPLVSGADDPCSAIVGKYVYSAPADACRCALHVSCFQHQIETIRQSHEEMRKTGGYSSGGRVRNDEMEKLARTIGLEWREESQLTKVAGGQTREVTVDVMHLTPEGRERWLERLKQRGVLDQFK
jgi:hypothetical protein